MEYAKDEVFDVHYDSVGDKQQFKRAGVINKLIFSVKEHKFISCVVALFVIFSAFNCFLIYYFMVLLQRL